MGRSSLLAAVIGFGPLGVSSPPPTVPGTDAEVPAVATTTAAPGTTAAGGPALELRPAVTDFGQVPTSEARTRTVEVVNVGDESVTLGDVDVDGGGFSIGSDGCSGREVEPGARCVVTIVFRPTGTGVAGGRVTVDAPVALGGELVGRGIGPGASVPVPTDEPASTDPAPQTTAGAVPTTGPPATAPDGSEGPGQDLADELARCEADAAEAEVTFAPALRMVVGEVTDVDVSAVIGAGPVVTTSPGGPPVTVVPAVLRCEVEATLRGQGFAIDPSDPQAASFLDRPTITWTWQVTPARAGARTLQFRILPVARSGDVRLPGTPVLFEATISVDAATASFWQRLDRIARGVAGHPVVTGFGALAGVAAVVAGGWRWLLGRPWPWAAAPPPGPRGAARRWHRRGR